MPTSRVAIVSKKEIISAIGARSWMSEHAQLREHLHVLRRKLIRYYSYPKRLTLDMLHILELFSELTILQVLIINNLYL